MKYNLTDKQTAEVAAILDKGNRVELIPVKDNIKIIEIIRKEHKTSP
ncbi:MAG: hypothetical protein II574_00275 [Ruminococcus sp.]|nr:hypothetical protein [Ruminococcus sp.]